MWVYRARIGTLTIKPLDDGRYGLFYDDELWGSWHSPWAAADEVYTHSSGCTDWDMSDEDGPTDLSEWMRVRG